MGMVGEQQAVCSVLELKCSQVCRKVDESRLSDTHTVNEGQAGTVQAKKKKMEEEGIPKREMNTCKKQEKMIVMDTKLETQMMMITMTR